MAFTSPIFLIFVLLVVLLMSATRSTRLRSWLLLLANAVFLGSHVNHPLQLLPFLAFVAVGYVSIEVLRRSRSTPLLWAGIAVVVASFVWLKKYAFVPSPLELPLVYTVVGLSYVLFRIVHLMIDAKQGELTERISPLSFLNYTSSFLTLTAGPIQRYDDFQRQQSEPEPLSEASVFRAFARVIEGFIKLAVISAIFNYLFATVSARVLDPHAALSWPGLLSAYLASVVFYTVFLYANFAGYMDIVIGVGWLLGQRLPENFDHPFRARSFLDFWARWHITLSQWFRTYVFNPLLQALATRVSSRKLAPYLAVAAFFVTFLLMGVWHGATSVFVVYGLFMGAGASINKLWQLLAVKRFGKARYKAFGERPTVVYLSRGLTFSYFAFGLSCLWLNLAELVGIAARLGPSGIFLGYVGVALGAAVLFFAWDLLARALEGLKRGVSFGEPGVVGQNLALGLRVLLIVSVSSFFHKAPEFVYRAF
jgi:D-alanyl-lipoteichoic acid acyltransferase DltB (MBOAT superfamily)